MRHRFRAGWVMLAVWLAACAGPGTPSAGQVSQPQQQPAQSVKRVVAGLRGDPATLSAQLSRVGAGRTYGISEIERMLNPGMVRLDDHQELQPGLAVDVPTVDNGAWELMSDGRMVTTWKIRPNVTWHDGAPFTSDDLLFSVTVGMDPELAEWKDAAFNDIEGLSAPDASTVVINWKRPFISANAMFTGTRALPQPKHLLEKTYTENKASYNTQLYWSEEYVGTGAYRLREFVRGSYMRLEAYDNFTLGRPAINEIEIKFIQDANALATNILAGAVDMTLSGSSLTLEQAAQVRDQHWDGNLVPELAGSIGVFPQFINPNPVVLLDPQFRRALLMAVDRQLLVETLQHGLSQIAHTNMVPDNPEFKFAEPRLVKYPFDPRRSAQLIESLGYSKAGEGSYQDPVGQRLSVELRSTPGREVNEKTTFAVADMWQQIGMGVDTIVLSPQLNQDREYRQTRPAFELVGQPEEIYRLHSREIPTAENRFVGDNRPRYSNPQLDDLINRYFLTIPTAERGQIVGDMYNLITDQVVLLNFFYEATQRLEAKRLRGPSTPLGWNVEKWDTAP